LKFEIGKQLWDVSTVPNLHCLFTTATISQMFIKPLFKIDKPLLHNTSEYHFVF